MDKLSVELHSHIFQFACIDNGFTARSLALVSHYVREVARPFLYQSLVVAGIDQMFELVSRLAIIPPHLRRIRHLHLSDWTHDQVKQGVPMRDEDTDRYNQEKTVAIRIMFLASPTLETFTLITSCPITSTPLIAYLWSLPFPHLRELSLKGMYSFPHAASCMPRLERLHLAGNRNPHGLLRLGVLDAACPALTHLRISGLLVATSFVNELHEALKEDSESQTPFVAKLPPTVQHVVVQQGLGPPGKKCNSVAARHAHTSALLRQIASAKDLKRPVRFSLLDRSSNEDVYRDMLDHWEKRLDGDERYWLT
ncbi:hypothetical protein AcW1_003186 [Taiwanofungus camphoratus]|nr:hypothetical protein AcW1_003186 [Antrodia cinnamomea]